MNRIPLLTGADLNPAQQAVHAAIVSGPRGVMVGPLRAALHSPLLAERWSALGEALRYGTSVPDRLRELAIIVSARHWNSALEWTIHAAAAAQAGLDEQIIEAIRIAAAPPIADGAERAVYTYTRDLLERGAVADAAYAAVHDALGTVGIVELTGVIGYYAMVSLTLNAHHIVLADAGGVRTLQDGLPAPDGLTTLAALA